MAAGRFGGKRCRLVGKLWLGNLNEWEVTGGERERERQMEFNFSRRFKMEERIRHG